MSVTFQIFAGPPDGIFAPVLRGARGPKVRLYVFFGPVLRTLSACLAIIVIKDVPKRTLCRFLALYRGCMLNHRHSSSQGFTLTELIVVMAIIGILSSIALSMIASISTSNNVALACANISQYLDLARGRAMADATYVFVGFDEVVNSPTPAQATATQGGKIVVLAVASENGTNNYLSGTWQTNGNLVALTKPTYFSNVHLADFSSLTAASGPMASRVSPIAAGDSLGNAGTSSPAALFYWPSSATSASSAQYSFSKAIQFDPSGVASIQLGTNSTPNPGWLEIGLQATHGATIPPAPTDLTTGQVASIQIDGITGVNRIFRP